MYLWEKLRLNIVFQEPFPCFLCSSPIPSHPILCFERKENFRFYIWLKGSLTLASIPVEGKGEGREEEREEGKEGDG